MVSREELDVHCESLDSELGQLKDLLHNSGFSLDASTLLGVSFLLLFCGFKSTNTQSNVSLMQGRLV